MKGRRYDKRTVPEWKVRFLDRPLVFRRALTATIFLLLITVALLFAASERDDFERAAELVRTQERRIGALVEVDDRGRFGEYYIIAVDGQNRTLAYGEFIADKTPGAAVPFVVDPEDDARPIAVGSPDDWDSEPANVGTTTVALALALVVGYMAASEIIPEDVSKHRARRKGRTGPR